jgi:hypothetical protein
VSYTSDHIIQSSDIMPGLALAAAEEIEQLESENARLADACRRFRHFVNARGGSWAEMLEVLNATLDRDDDRKQEAHQETVQDEMRDAWREEMRRDAFGGSR